MPAPRLVPEGEWQEIVRRYRAGEGIRGLSEVARVSRQRLVRELLQRGVTFRSPSEARRIYSCNHDFFGHIETERQAYWMGFIAADGCVTDDGRLSIYLAAKDRDHLHKFRQALDSDHHIREFTARQGFGADHGRPSRMAALVITSRPLVVGLARYGIVPRKTLTVSWPHLPDDLLRHYLRGYFDGDGSVHRGGANRSGLVFSLIGNLPFLTGCQSYLIDALRLAQTKIRPNRPGSPVSVLEYAGRGQVQDIARLMYQGATVFLERKRSVFETAPTIHGRKGVTRTHCVRGHEMTPENTMPRNGCRECSLIRQRAWHHENYQPRPLGHPRSRTHCPRGHEYSEENTYRYDHGAFVSRHCRICRDAHSRAYKARQRHQESTPIKPSDSSMIS